MSFKMICFLPLGYPTLDDSLALADMYAAGGCDMIEVGWPTDNAYLDSETVRSSMAAALQNCSDPERYFETIVRIRQKHPDIPLILLVYDHSVVELGEEKFMGFCRAQGIDRLILVGEKDGRIKKEMMRNGLEVTCYVPFHLPDEEVGAAVDSNGFIYLQAKPAAEVKPGFETLEACIRFLKEEAAQRDIYCGVGVATSEDVRMVKQAGADGVFLGSPLLKRISDPPELQRYLHEVKTVCMSGI
mgnify:FL=1